MIKTLIDLDENLFQESITQLIQSEGLESTFINHLYPFLEKIGVMWLVGSINPAQEHFISNLITIGIMLVIKNYIVKEDKILAKINENKTKPKKESKFQKKMREMMEQAEAQKAKQNKK